MTVEVAWPTPATAEDVSEFIGLADEQGLLKFTPTVDTDGQGHILTIRVSGDPTSPPKDLR